MYINLHIEEARTHTFTRTWPSLYWPGHHGESMDWLTP